VESTPTQERQSLVAQLDLVRERLAAHERDLRSVDAELEEIATERQQYQLVHEACGALEKLAEQGAASLFWNGGMPDGAGESHVRSARARVDDFQRRVGEIEHGRQQVVSRIQLEQENCEILEEGLYEIELREEARKQEWVPEREIDANADRFMVMAWSRGGEEDERFWKSLGAALLLSLLLGVWLPLIDLPLPEWAPLEVPDRLTKLIQERPLPPPAPVRQETKPEEQEPPEEMPLLAQESPTRSKPEESPKPSAESKGILAFRDKFSALADHKPAARLGADARINRSGETATGRPERSMVASLTPGNSSGINLAALSRDVGSGDGGPIAGVQVARATSSIGTNGTGSDRPLAGGPGAGRTDEEIQIVFDRHKSALYRLYNRELRRDPTLRAGPRRAGGRARQDVRLRRQGGAARDDPLPDRLPARDLNRRSRRREPPSRTSTRIRHHPFEESGDRPT
jgi:hypothetical protein